jgi:hypothetical protein
VSTPTQNLTPFHGGVPIVMKLHGYAHDVIAIVYENEEKPGWFYLERPVEYWTDPNGGISLKRWMYLSCQTLFEIRSVDMLSHGEINDNVITMYVELSDKYYTDLRTSDMTANDMPNTLEEAEAPDEELTAMLDREQDDPETCKPPIQEPRKISKKEKDEQDLRLMQMLRNMPVPKIRH